MFERLKDKMKSVSFWLGILSVVVLVLQIVGSAGGGLPERPVLSELIGAACGVLLTFGIIKKPDGGGGIGGGGDGSLSDAPGLPAPRAVPVITQNA
jgi:uncharacterized membrane protein